MLDTCSYLFKTLKQEIVDELTIFREITEYYVDSIHETMVFKNKINTINNKLKAARNYEEWSAIAQEHDALPQIHESLNTVYSPYYDYEYIEELKNELKQARKQGETAKLVSILRSHSSRNVGNITSHLLYREAYNSTKKVIEEFQEEVVKCLRAIMMSDMPNMKKLEFFGELRHSVGRSALLLSGGAILGMYHIGVVQVLMEADCMPSIIAGSSAGSMVAAFVATRKQGDFFDGNKLNFSSFAKKKRISFWKDVKRVVKSGFIMDINVLKEFLKDNLGDITFQEAFDRFGYILNITVTGTTQYDQDRLLNYLTAPNVMIWSAVAASCAIPFIFGATSLFCKGPEGEAKPYTLMNRKYLDGSIAHDLPMNKLSIFFNVNNFIVSQTNPWVIPFMNSTEYFRTTSNGFVIRLLIVLQHLKEFFASELRHRVGQIGFIFPKATKFFNLATQSYVGNITIWPVPSLSNYLRILENPTEFKRIMNFVEDGRFRTYPKISQIRSSLFYEKEITMCFKTIKRNSFIIPELPPNNVSMNESMKEVSEFDEDDYFVSLAKVNDRITDDEQEDGQANNKKMKYRNQSFMIPRGNSFV